MSDKYDHALDRFIEVYRDMQTEITRLRAQLAETRKREQELLSERKGEGVRTRRAIAEAKKKWLSEAEGQDVLYVVLDTNTGRPESEFVEIENAEGFSVEVFSVIDSGGFRRIGPLYTHPAPAKVPEVNFDDVPVSVKELTPEAAWICGYYAYREAMLEAQGGE